MARYGMNEIRKGTKILVDGDPCVVEDADFLKPGKAQPTSRLTCLNLRTRRKLAVVVKRADTFEAADVVERTLQYLHRSGPDWHFANPATHEAIVANEAAVGAAAQWLKGSETCEVTLWNDTPVAVAAPNFVELLVRETDPGQRGNTSGGGSKPATLETGAVVRVPLFVQIGDTLRIDTRSGGYVKRLA